ncbi:AAA family ATPase [Sutcliffiella halmapala]|uniref:AAA family ATPase n=1 Tax=Sutcliffiella halmapala TaxID=79882 RepID=UPI000995358A|nr:AAA family ATPase [Sutcliffiella halmapala]
MKKAIIFITGMSGTGKSAILEKLSNIGYQTIDTDYNQLSKKTMNQDGHESEWLWDEGKIIEIIHSHREGILFISGTVSNQGKFYRYFNEIIYLSAPLSTILDRIQTRTTNNYGKTDKERQEIIDNYHAFGSIIESSSTIKIDTTNDLETIVNEIETLAMKILV